MIGPFEIFPIPIAPPCRRDFFLNFPGWLLCFCDRFLCQWRFSIYIFIHGDGIFGKFRESS